MRTTTAELAAYAEEVLGVRLQPWQLTVLEMSLHYRHVKIDMPRRGKRFAMDPRVIEALDLVQFERHRQVKNRLAVALLVAEWDAWGWLDPTTDRPVMLDVRRMLASRPTTSIRRKS